jgi:hypothetical protein
VTIIAVAVLGSRQAEREAVAREMPGGETILNAPPRYDPPPYAERRDKPVTDVDIWLAANSSIDRYGASAAMHAEREAKRSPDRRDRKIWLAIERAITEREAEPKAQHGAAAEIEAGRKADLMLDRGDRDGQLVWMRIKRAIVELRAEPSGPAH